MELNPADKTAEKPSILSFDKSTVVVWVVIGLILVETFSGVLRFYFDKAGISPLLYVPKMACVLLFALELRTFRAGRLFWACMLLWVFFAMLAMLHGASLFNIAFSLFALSPLFFGLVCSEYLFRRRKLLAWAIGFCLLASLAGLALDKYTFVPWKGYTYSVGETQLSANMSWSADDEDRIAGFARMSSLLSILIALYSLYLLMFIRSRPLILLLSTVALYGIVLTTSKAPAVAFVLTLGLLLIQRMTWPCRLACILAVMAGLLLPTLGLLHDFDARTVSSGGSSLASLYDRLNNTWPNIVDAMTLAGWGMTGAGFGMVGSTLTMFPVPGADIFMTIDSSVVYLWVMLGISGLLLYALQIPLFFALINEQNPLSRMLLAIGFCCCLISWTTDIFEVTVANLFIGLAVGHVLFARREEDVQANGPAHMQINALPAPH
ncbi:membrane protein [Pseudomonas cichorii]|uniref:Membrane protein n=1 Tax=Pseudomonas cichorii TaxID=36746 RepID=A0A3M4VNN2_PSECI|nr:membrane protein [Pseudomonas cichorii]AHF70302.1 hypothetical protein PCH70_51490 [Pseudomonas cichorii JBC1]QVE17168.1 hypothetical protein KGD89_25725 [Pseudomonas cichorii]RMR53415.1 hypothetical protein ALP84_01054 [Pseudomonas cichorii]SDO57066.1 hypothetical protein SAMN05216599_110120 [Pseudomonas cichorii]GFM77897.1 membrane protein [Pseudomonas cichorii]